MNRVELMGRVARDPETRYTNGDKPMAISRYSIAVNRRGKKDEADFISCIAFGKSGEFAEKYLKKGMRIIVCGHIQTGSYEKDGHKVYTTDVVVDEHEFCESKKEEQKPGDAFVNVPIEEELPFA